MGSGRSKKGVVETYRTDYDEDIHRESRLRISNKGNTRALSFVETEENEGFFKVEKPNKYDQMLCIKP